MSDINIGMAFAVYLADPSIQTAEAVVLALESRPDLPIKAEQTRKALIDGIPTVPAAKAGSAGVQTGALMQRLLKGRP